MNHVRVANSSGLNGNFRNIACLELPAKLFGKDRSDHATRSSSRQPSSVIVAPTGGVEREIQLEPLTVTYE